MLFTLDISKIQIHVTIKHTLERGKIKKKNKNKYKKHKHTPQLTEKLMI